MTAATERACPVCGGPVAGSRLCSSRRCRGRWAHKAGRTYRHVCSCGREYVTSDPQAGFCSDRCRERVHDAVVAMLRGLYW